MARNNGAAKVVLVILVTLAMLVLNFKFAPPNFSFYAALGLASGYLSAIRASRAITLLHVTLTMIA